MLTQECVPDFVPHQASKTVTINSKRWKPEALTVTG
jgi:hypothetical protein